MANKDTFSDLGTEFQKKLIAQILDDAGFGFAILPILESRYFDNPQCRRIFTLIKDYNEKYHGQLPSIDGLREKMMAEVSDDIEKLLLSETIKELPSKIPLDKDQTQDLSLNFCKHKEFVKAMGLISEILKKHDFQKYPQIHNIMNDALNVGIREKNTFDILENIEKAFDEDYRNPIPTGIDGIDEAIKGGLGKNEFGFLIMPTGTGKTTMLTKIANTAYSLGYNVLQIFFEDKVSDIQRKHASALTHIPLGDIPMYKQTCLDALYDADKKGGLLHLKKCPSDSTSVADIKQYLAMMRGKGVVYDMVIVDYIDCLIANKGTTGNNSDHNVSEGTVIRQLESLCSDENIALWSAVQSNRTGANSEEVGLDMIQGSFKRAQVGHLIISVAKTDEQKELGLATCKILKSRFGGDGKTFKNMTFDNSRMIFNTKESTLLSTYNLEDRREEKERNDQRITMEALEMAKIAKQKKEEAKRLKEANKSQVETPKQTSVMQPNFNPDDEVKQLVAINNIEPFVEKEVKDIEKPKPLPINDNMTDEQKVLNLLGGKSEIILAKDNTETNTTPVEKPKKTRTLGKRNVSSPIVSEDVTEGNEEVSNN